MPLRKITLQATYNHTYLRQCVIHINKMATRTMDDENTVSETVTVTEEKEVRRL